MKRNTLSIVILVCSVLVLLIVSTFTAVSSAKAQLGNTGVPVRCSTDGEKTSGAVTNLLCTAADGTEFPKGTDVPTGHYLMITDILVHPSYSGPATGDWAFYLYQLNDGTTLVASTTFETQTRASFSEHYTTPYYVLPQGAHLQVINFATNSGSLSVNAAGLLTTNAYYAPFIGK